MNNDEIIRMAVDAGIIPWTKHEYVGGKNFSASDDGLDGDLASLIQFAALVASAERERLTDAAMKAAEKAVDVAIALEREACAKVCDAWQEWGADGALLAKAIRARGQV